MAVVLFAVLALAVNGASAAQRLFSAHLAPREAEKEVSQSAQLLPGPPSPEETPGSMTPGEPNSEAYAYLSAQSVLDSNNSQRCIEDDFAREGAISDAFDRPSSRSSIRSTASLVSSRLGVQFTLVGAKPSGTS